MRKLHQIGKTLKSIFLGWPLLLPVDGFAAPLPVKEEIQQQLFPFCDLARDIQCHILSFITPEERVHPGNLVSKEWYELVMGDLAPPVLHLDFEDFLNRYEKLKKSRTEITSDQLLKAFLRFSYSRIDLNNSPLSVLPSVAEALKETKALKTLCFRRAETDGSNVDDEIIWQALAQIMHIPSLETAHLRLGDLSVEQTEFLGKCLEKHPLTLKNLFLDIGDDLTGKKVTAILAALEQNKTLTYLQFSILYPSPKKFEMALMPYDSLKIGFQGMERLITFLKDHQQLTSYHLASNAPDCLPEELLLRALKVIKDHQSLKNLCLTLNEESDDIDKGLAAVIKKSNSEGLELLSEPTRNIKINLETAKALYGGCLTCLSVSGLTFSQDAFAVFIDALTQPNLRLKLLQINSQLSDTQILMLIKALQQPFSRINKMILPIAVLEKFQEEKAQGLEEFLSQPNSLSELAMFLGTKEGLKAVNINIKALRQLSIQNQISAFYKSLFIQFFNQEKHLLIVPWVSYLIQSDKLPDPLLDLVGNFFLPLANDQDLNNKQVGIKLFKELIAARENPLAKAHAWLGVYYSQLGEYEVSLEYFKAAADIDLEIIESRFFPRYVGDSYYHMGNQEVGLTYYEKFVTNCPSISPQLHIQYAEKHRDLADFLQRANALDANGNGPSYHWQKAAMYYEKGMKLEGVDPQNYIKAAEVYYTLQEWKKCSQYLELYFQNSQEPIATNLYLMAGKLAYRDNNFSQAVIYYEKGFHHMEERDQTFSIAHYRFAGDAHLTLGHFDRAIKYFKVAVEEDPELKFPALFYPDRFYLAIAYFRTQQFDLTLAEYDQLISQNPECTAIFYFGAAQAAFKLKQWERVIDLYDKGLICPDADQNKNTLHSVHKNKRKAISYLERMRGNF